MAKIKAPRYFKWRDGRPRWEPGPGLRAKGWKGQNLQDEDGRWLGLEAAIAAAGAINTQVATSAPGKTKPQRRRQPRTVDRLCAEYFERSPKFKRKRGSTQADYRKKAKVFREWCGDAPVKAIDKPTMHRFYEHLYVTRGHAMANGVLRVASVVLSHGVRVGWLDTNPAFKLELEGLAPRVVLWLPEEVKHLVETAEAMGEHGVADAFVIAIHTAQRQGDVLSLPQFIFTRDRIALTQSKTGAHVDVKCTPQLTARIAGMRARRKTNHWDNVPTMVVDDRTGMPFNSHTFRHRFAGVRAAAALKMPAIASKQFMDTRDTAITRLAMAGNSLIYIASISGHAFESIQGILKHYVALTADMADAGIDNLIAWMEKEGIEL